MTKVLKLEMKGFKSFATKTEIPFGDDFNCVLGPNGSGKSNILDAICFVLGKAGAKGLRAEKSANLIYNGGKKKTPSKEGEVSIYFDNKSKIFNSTDKIIKITRIIRQTGQSVYKINDKTVTRQQVLDLLSKARINPDGYNIILQGDIIRLVEMSGNERRQIVEEIAGISVYEEKKQKALRELERVEGRINEAQIILAERKTYLKELKADRDKASKFKDLDDKIKRNKATIIDKDIREKTVKKEKHEKEIDSFKSDIAKYEDGIQIKREKITKIKKDVDQINKEVEEKGEKEQVKIHKEVEQLKIDVALNKQRVESIDQELKKIISRRNEQSQGFKDVESKLGILEKTKKEINEKINYKEKQIAEIQKKIDEFKKKNKLENASDIDKEIEEIDQKIESLQEDINKLRETQQESIREKDKYETKLQTIDEKIQKLLEVEKENKEQVEKLKQFKVEFKNATTDLNKSLTEDSSLAAQQSNAHQKLLSRKEEQSKLQARTQSIREHLAGGQAIQTVLSIKDSNIHGLISELGNVNKEHSMALEVAAGARMRSIVVETDATAEKCINHLKQNRSGIATFIPLNKIKSVPVDPKIRSMKQAGVIGPAIDLIEFDKKYEKAFLYVFANTLVVKDITTARKIGVGTVRMVTLDGDLVETSGAMQGGHRQRERQIGFVEKETKEKLDRLNKDILELEGVRSNLDVKRRDNEELITRLREMKANLEGEIIKLEKILRLDEDDTSADKNVKKEISALMKEKEKLIDETTNKIMQKNSELAQFKSKKQMLRDQINQLRNPRLLAELTSYEQKQTELKQEISELKLEIRGTDAQRDTILGPERENLQKILKQLDKEEKDFKEEQKDLQELLKGQEKELKTKEESEKKFYAQFKDLFNKRNKLTDEINSLENQILKDNDSSRQKEQKMNITGMENAKVKAELAGLAEEMKQYEGVPIYKNKPVEDIKKEIKDFEKMRENIGAVNMKALEIYDNVEKEYIKLTEKKEKLTHEQEDVLLMINEVDSKKKELFMKTYEVVNHNFKEIFKTLSTKGSASLDLEDKKDVFNGGLHIKVKLSGSKYMDIRSLSGGEKTMTALAFIFAVQEHDPAAFYVLDEVDAALDKKNSERLAKLVKQYSNRAQYIMISHNDGVIGEADQLYGISMNEHGMSKITTLKV
ncbi:chromosome segregation protein SMC [Candidatus Woesearchaeota archaeon]|nr:chromosome segregation protein SMC [Candidatus Woesearchaeota archaeon]MCF8013770.1 chromosome segregation protein SMC [Candidatus Woesearchaeota archaeon]